MFVVFSVRLSFFHAFSSVVMQMSGYNLQRWGTASALPNYVVNCVVLLLIVLFVLFNYIVLCIACM